MTASIPRGPSIGSSSAAAAAASDAPPTAAAVSPDALLDALDFSTNSRYYSAPAKDGNAESSQEDNDSNDEHNSPQENQQQHDFDPIAFLNQHYYTEQQLVTALPTLRSAISTRLSTLDDSLSTTLRHQASLAPLISQDVLHARNAVHQLATRMHSVKTQALQSESAVIEITRDMKRLDYAKRHLQRTITALKRLHMLLHAAEQLRMAATIDESKNCPIPNYKAASQLIDATRLLLGHFDGYMNSVPKMRQVRDAIGMLNSQLREGAVNLFHEVGFQQGEEEETAPMVVGALSDACLVIDALGEKSKEDFVKEFISDHLEEYESLYSPFPAKKKGGGDGTTTIGSGGNSKNSSKSPPRPPPGSPPKSFKKSASSMASSQSDDVTTTESLKATSVSSSSSTNASSSSSSLDQVEQRFAWYRSKLRSLQLKFTNVFPLHWNLYYHLTVSFLERTARHLKFILKKHSATVRIAPFNPNTKEGGGDSSSSTLATPSMIMSASAVTQAASKFGMSVNNSSAHGDGGVATDGLSDGEKAVTALLKALQKTILFEKEMSAWLSRDFGTQFVDPSEIIIANDTKKKRGDDNKNEEGGEEEALEFDEQGRAVAAGSAEGIRIKYERRKRMGGGAGSNRQGGIGGGPVPQLMGMASVTFDNYMSPYVALEERTMDEQLHAALADNTVDTRGAQPVFVSSTNLFIYMKNSITRCTALTKEKTFFLLQRSFQKKLQSYAKVLDKKLPQPQTQIAAKMASLVDSTQATNTVYRIPPGQEVTVCYVIDTCEYCADTVEALEDLIRDKIGSKYQDKIDMSEEQGAFQDVTAKCIRVLVSGLEQRLDAPLKELSRTNWSSFDMVGEESSYVRTIQLTIHPFVTEVRQLIPSSYFRSFCDKFAMTFASTYYRTLTGLKRISEAGTQQLLLDVTTIKSLLLKLPVLEAEKKPGAATRHSNVNQSKSLSGASTIAPAMYTKMVNKEFRKLEVMLKLVGSPKDMLVDMFRAQWDSSIDTSRMASDFQTIATLKGIPRNDHAAMLESLGVEAVEGRVGADSSMTVNIQALQEKGSDVAAKVNADLDQMRQRVDRFRNAFR
eukprot:scaffold4151_cov137-Skeletonema_menzelii.AAC.4